MKNYKFKVKKVIENTIQLDAENYREGLADLLQFLLKYDKMVFEKSPDKDVSYDIILDQKIDKQDLKDMTNIREILHRIEVNDTEDDEDLYIENDIDEDDFDEENDDFDDEDFEETDEEIDEKFEEIADNLLQDFLEFLEKKYPKDAAEKTEIMS